MNLKEFIEHRKCCPLCGKELFVNYHCARRQTLRFEEDRMIFTSRLDDYPFRISNQKYKIGYSFDSSGSGWCIEFYDSDNIRLQKVPLFLIKKLMDRVSKVNKIGPNQSSCFIKQCTNAECGMYACGTNDFDLDFKNPSVSFEMRYEVFTFGQPSESGQRTFILQNYYLKNSSILTCSLDDPSNSSTLSGRSTTIDLPLIPFVSKEETIARLNKLIIFS